MTGYLYNFVLDTVEKTVLVIYFFFYLQNYYNYLVILHTGFTFPLYLILWVSPAHPDVLPQSEYCTAHSLPTTDCWIILFNL